MEPRRLTLKGVTRFHDSTTIDLSTLPDGLIAVVGPNGAGKTTLLEALAPAPLWLEFPSRPGVLRDKVTRRDSLIDLEFDYRGHRWRIVVQIDPGTGRSGARTEAYLYQDGQPVPDWPTPGRVKDYRAAVAALFPDRAVFMASAFSAWTGAGNFLELDRAERRDLFTTMLGNGRLQELHGRARAVRQPLDAALAQLGRLGEQLERDRQAAAALEAEHARILEQLERAAGVRGAAEAAADLATAKRAEAAAALAALQERQAATARRRQEVERRRGELGAELDRLRQAIAAGAEVLDAAPLIRKLVADREQLVERRRELVAAYREQAAEVAGAIGRRDALDRETAQAAQTLEDLAGTLADLEQLEHRAGELAEAPAAYQRLTDGLAELLGEVSDLKRAAIDTETARAEAAPTAPNLQAIGLEVEHLAQLAAGVDDAPCGGLVLFRPGTGIFSEDPPSDPHDLPPEPVECGACPFLQEARTAAARLEQRRADLAAAEKRAEDLGRLTAAAMDAKLALQEAERRLTSWRRDLKDAERDAQELARIRQRLERRVSLEARRAQLTKRRTTIATVERPQADRELAELQATLQRTKAEGGTAKAQLEHLDGAPDDLRKLQEVEAAQPGRLERLAALEQDARRLGEQLEADPDPPGLPGALQAYAEAQAAAERAQGALRVAREAEGRHREALGHARGRRAELGDLEGRGEALAASRAGLERRRAGFRLLEQALGRDGIQALEIDAAGPTVSNLTNDLLAASYGARFTVSLRTVRPASEGRRQREVFNLVVHDGDRGGVRDVAELSKGERILIDEAIKLGIAMFHGQRAGADVATLWRDECDGGLDPANRSRYPAMLRRALELGGFRRIFYVSHAPEVAAQADGMIRIGADGSIALETR